MFPATPMTLSLTEPISNERRHVLQQEVAVFHDTTANSERGYTGAQNFNFGLKFRQYWYWATRYKFCIFRRKEKRTFSDRRGCCSAPTTLLLIANISGT